MVVTKQETLNHEEHGAIMKHKCGKDSSIVPSLFFSFFCLGSLASFHIFFYFLTWDNALIMMIITLLLTHSSKFRTMMTLWKMPPAVYRDVQRSSLADDVETSH